MIFFIILFLSSSILLCDKPNIILISIDTLNVNRTSLFNYDQNTTPFLKDLSKKGYLLKNSYTPTPLTLPAHCTLLTGIFPHNLGVYDNLNSSLLRDCKTIPAVLKENGYTTCAIVSSYILSSSFGISRGFDFFEEISLEELKGGALSIPERDAKKTTELGIAHLKKLKTPFFLFIHYFDPHIPYHPPEPFKSNFKNPYDGEVAYVDFEIERLFKSYNKFKNCWIFIVSDHGEGLSENEELTHGYFLYKTTVQVLFLVIPPEKEKIKINSERLTSLADVFPTILKITGIENFEEIDGIDIFEEKNKRFLPLETLYGFFHHNFSPLRGITDGEMEYIFNFSPYNREYEKILKSLFKNSKQPMKFYEKGKYDKDLTSLGYLSGPAKEIPSMEKWKNFPSPFEKKHFINKIVKIFDNNNLLRNLKELEILAPSDPEVLKLLGDYYKKNGEYKKSINYYEKALKNSPLYFEIFLNLAQSYLKIKKFENALQSINIYLKAIQNNPIAFYYKGAILDQMGKNDEAVSFFKKAIQKGFINQDIIIKISLSLIKLKREKEAESIIEDYLKKNKSAVLFYILGNINKEKDKEKAIYLYNESIKLMPNFLPNYIELSDILKVEEGKKVLRKAIEQDPSFDIAWEKLGDLYIKEGNRKAAIECYNNAYKYSKEKERLRKKIEEIKIE